MGSPQASLLSPPRIPNLEEPVTAQLPCRQDTSPWPPHESKLKAKFIPSPQALVYIPTLFALPWSRFHTSVSSHTTRDHFVQKCSSQYCWPLIFIFFSLNLIIGRSGQRSVVEQGYLLIAECFLKWLPVLTPEQRALINDFFTYISAACASPFHNAWLQQDASCIVLGNPLSPEGDSGTSASWQFPHMIRD